MTSPLAALPPNLIATGTSSTKAAPSPEREKALKAARDFESIFVRQLLKPLEKSSGLGGKSASAGGEIYGSMYVNSIAEAVSKGGGLGMSDLIADALAPTSHAAPTPGKR